MYGLRIQIQASAALTFRVLPSGILDIITYPFVPPTTLSGWLRRIWMLAEGHDLPETTAKKDAPFFVLPKEVISLGAYPDKPSHVHKTKRKGMKDFKDTSFTRLVFDKNTGPTFQLHTWEYLTTDKLSAYVVSKEESYLQHLSKVLLDGQQCIPWGCKLGKEGFGFVSDVSEVQVLEQQKTDRASLTLLPLDIVIEQETPIDFSVHNIHRFAWKTGSYTLTDPSPVEGYDMLPLALTTNQTLEANWWIGQDMHFPVGLENVLSGSDV